MSRNARVERALAPKPRGAAPNAALASDRDFVLCFLLAANAPVTGYAVDLTDVAAGVEDLLDEATLEATIDVSRKRPRRASFGDARVTLPDGAKRSLGGAVQIDR